MKLKCEGNFYSAVIFWGVSWGISESILGYMLHFTTGIAGFFMFPIGFYFMRKAFKETDRLISIFLISAIASGFKLIDIFLPSYSVITTINPAICILMEAAAVFVFFKIVERKRGSFNFRDLLIAVGMWRIPFFIILVVSVLFLNLGDVIKLTPFFIVKFLLLDLIANMLLIYFYLKTVNEKKEWFFRRTKKFQLLVCSLVIIVAVYIQIIIH
jgi:hypothetical protein